MKNYITTTNSNVYEVTVEEGASTGAAPAARAAAPALKAVSAVAPKAAPAGAAGSVMVPAPTPSKILGVEVAVGQVVKKGDVVMVLEVIKMENETTALSDGTVAGVNVPAGGSMEAGATLVILS